MQCKKCHKLDQVVYLSGSGASVVGDSPVVELLSAGGGPGGDRAGGDLAVRAELPREHGGNQDLEARGTSSEKTERIPKEPNLT